MQILTLSGSLRAASSNTAVLDALPRIALPGMTVVAYRAIGQLPHFNPDVEAGGPPAAVLELRRLVGEADGLILSSPEYAHGIAGSFKNALDWLVGSLEFPGKPVALINAAPRATHAEAQAREILSTMSARLIDEAMLTLPIQGSRLDAAGIATTFGAPLTGAFAAAIEAG